MLRVIITRLCNQKGNFFSVRKKFSDFVWSTLKYNEKKKEYKSIQEYL